MKRFLILLGMLAGMFFVPVHASYGAVVTSPSASGKPVYCFARAVSCTSNVTTVAATDQILCAGTIFSATGIACSCPGTGSQWQALGTINSGSAVTFGLLTGCSVGANAVQITGTGGNAKTVTGVAEVITGNALLDVSAITPLTAVSAQGSIATPAVNAVAGDYCASWIVDVAGGGGTPQTPAAPFISEGSPNATFPENLADATAPGGAFSAMWTPHLASQQTIAAIACFKPRPAPLVISFRVCNNGNPQQCMDFPTNGINTLTLFMISNGTQSAPLATDSFTILPVPSQ